MLINISKGLNIPFSHPPEQKIYAGNSVETVALVGKDYIGRRGHLLVQVGDRVIKGQPVVRDKKIPHIIGAAPGTGVVEVIHRGPRRILETFVIRLDNDSEEQISFTSYTEDGIAQLTDEKIRKTLLISGLWTSFRTRPYSTLADPGTKPFAMFVTAMDTNPLAPDPSAIIHLSPDDFRRGVLLISKLCQGKTYVCKAADCKLPELEQNNQIETVSFSGPHPAGLVGTHIHFLAPVSISRQVWHIGYQDVIAIGKLFRTGVRSMERIISLAGPAVRQPRLLRTRLGACTNDLVSGELKSGDCRVISGPVLSGYQARGTTAYLGRYHNQVFVLHEGSNREMFGFLRPGLNMFSLTRAFASSLFPRKHMKFSTSQHGSARAMVPIGAYERVMPLDILITLLLRAIVIKDTETAQALGCLELDEEDIALCSFVDPGKFDFGPLLRENLLQIMKEA